MEYKHPENNTHVVERQEGVKILDVPPRDERTEWNNRQFKQELRVLAWAFSLGPDHPDSGFFRGGECKRCTRCSDEFNFLHYTSEKKAYCVRCYLKGFCDVVEDNTFFRVVIRIRKRTLIEILNPDQ